MTNKTIRRDWLREAYLIANGDKIPPKKEHVRAAIVALGELAKDVENLRGFMRKAYEAACRTRAEKGLPLPERPPGITDGEFKWPSMKPS